MFDSQAATAAIALASIVWQAFRSALPRLEHFDRIAPAPKPAQVSSFHGSRPTLEGPERQITPVTGDGDRKPGTTICVNRGLVLSLPLAVCLVFTPSFDAWSQAPQDDTAPSEPRNLTAEPGNGQVSSRLGGASERRRITRHRLLLSSCGRVFRPRRHCLVRNRDGPYGHRGRSRQRHDLYLPGAGGEQRGAGKLGVSQCNA